MSAIAVKIEIGHSVTLRNQVTEQGSTHDWTIFVRGAEGYEIQYFVEKVVFHLDESYPKPKRVIKEPPYCVSESAKAGFMMPIDVFFRSREQPKKVSFTYDCHLRGEDFPVKHIRVEKITFRYPSDDFRSKLLKAGAMPVHRTKRLSIQARAPPSSQHADDHPTPHPKDAEKEPRAHVASKKTKSTQPPLPKPSQPCTDIFGAPIRTKRSPDSSSVKSKVLKSNRKI